MAREISDSQAGAPVGRSRSYLRMKQKGLALAYHTVICATLLVYFVTSMLCWRMKRKLLRFPVNHHRKCLNSRHAGASATCIRSFDQITTGGTRGSVGSRLVGTNRRILDCFWIILRPGAGRVPASSNLRGHFDMVNAKIGKNPRTQETVS